MKRTILGLLLAVCSAFSLVALSAPTASAATMYNDGATFRPGAYVEVKLVGTIGEEIRYKVENQDGRVFAEDALMFDTDYEALRLGVLPAGQYQVALYTPMTATLNFASFTVKALPLTATTEANVPAFYPRVVDRYLDTFFVQVRASRRVTGAIRIRDTAGRVVYTASEQGTRFRFTWDGKNRNGRYVPLGRYVVEGALVTSDSVSKSFRHVVVVKSDTVMVTQRLSKGGNEANHISGTDNCFLNASLYDSELDMDCWGFFERAYAEARWGFQVPSKAKVLNWWIAGEVKCCDGGLLKKTIARDGDRVTLRLQIGGTRAMEVRSAGVTVKYPRTR